MEECGFAPGGGRETAANRANMRRSSPIVVTAEVTCHAGGRGFESRRSRLKKWLQMSRLCFLLEARTGPSVAQTWPAILEQRSLQIGYFCRHACSTVARTQAGHRSSRSLPGRPESIRGNPPRAQHPARATEGACVGGPVEFGCWRTAVYFASRARPRREGWRAAARRSRIPSGSPPTREANSR